MGAFDDLPNEKTGAGGAFDDLITIKPRKAEDRSFARTVADLGVSFAQGAVDVNRAVAAVGGADNVIAEGLGDASRGLDTHLRSDYARERRQEHNRLAEEAADRGMGAEAWQAVKNFADAPGDYTAQGLGSVAGLYPALKTAGLTAARAGLGALGAKAVQFGAVGAPVGVGATKLSQYEEVHDYLRSKGIPEDQARAKSVEAQSYGKDNAVQHAIGAALGGVDVVTGGEAVMMGGKRRLLDTLRARGVNALRRGGEEFGTEFLQAGHEKFAGNLAAIDVGDTERNPLRGVVGSGVQEGLMGFSSGAALGSVERGRQSPVVPIAGDVQAEKPELPQAGGFETGETGGSPPASRPVKISEAEKALAEFKPITALDRVVEIDRALSNASSEEVSSLTEERERITASWPKAIPGLTTSFSTETGVRLDGRYALMDADELTTSHDEGLRPVPAYPAELQPRERERHASEMQIGQIVQKLDPARLGESADVATGAPIVGADGLVESGNARTIALKRAYRANGQKAADYRQFLTDNAARFGLSAEDIAGVGKPVLVRVRETPVNRAEFARQANQATVARMSPSEQARSDAAQIDSLEDLNPTESGDFSSGASAPFVRRFMAKLPATEQSGLIDAAGQLSQAGYQRIRNAVLAKAYGDSPVLQRMVESLDSNVRNVGAALLRVAPQVAKTREAIDAGALHEADITPDLLMAVEELSALKEKGTSVREALAQSGMFGDKLTPEARELLDFLDANIRSPRRIAEFVQNYIGALEAAGNPNQGSLLGDATAPAKGDLLAAAKRGQDGIAEDGGQPEAIARTGEEIGQQPENAPGDSRSAQGNEEARRNLIEKQWNEALGDLGAIVRDYAHVARMVPEDTPNLMPTLVKLFEAGFGKVGYAAKDLIAYVKAELKKLPEFKSTWNKIAPETYRKAAARALANHQAAPQQDLFAARVQERQAQADLFSGQEAAKVGDGKTAKPSIPGIPDTWKLATNGKEYTDEHGFIRAINLTERERKAEQDFYDRILGDIDGLVKKYSERFGQVVDPDLAKGLSPAFAADQTLAAAVHEPSSHLTKIVWQRKLAESGDGNTIFTAGGGGSGKTESGHVARAILNLHDNTLTFDSTLSSVPSAIKKIDQALKSGKTVHIIYTNTPIEKAFRFAMSRPRVVRLVDIAEKHVGASSAIVELTKHYANNEKVVVSVVNNYGSKEEIHEGVIDDVPRYDYNEIEGRLYEIVVKEREAGGLSDEKFRAIVYGYPRDAALGSVGQGSAQAGSGKPEDQLGRVGRSSGQDAGDDSAGLVGQGRQDESNRGNDATGAQGQVAVASRGTDRKRATQQLREGAGGNDLFADNEFGASDGESVRVRQDGRSDGAREDNERRASAGQGDRAGRATGIPAGRDIPAKSGRNYRFGDGDLTYEGGWQKKAAQNVEAVELAKKLETEGRQATREEQAVLAKFIGWGASEIRNSIFGDKLDKQLQLQRRYDDAIVAFDRTGKSAFTRQDTGFYAAFEVVNAKQGGGLNYYSVGQITRDQVEAAKPDSSVKKWGDLRDRLKAALTEGEWATAERSTQYAHYTSKAVVQSMWKAVERMGFKGGAILEPGAGIGVFPGLMDSALATNSAYTGIEYDALTGAILKRLFPDERILVESFVDSSLPDNFYDMAIGNPPFANVKILSDPKYKKHAFSLHDYFFAKSIDKVKPGGLMVYVTSRYTMDKQGDKARKYLADRADLIGAVRLPQTAFQKNAGTEVVTDVLFLRKRAAGDAVEKGATNDRMYLRDGLGNRLMEVSPWTGVQKIQTAEGPALINEYFADHPEMVLGTHSLQGSMYSKNEYTVLPNKEIDIEAQFAAAVENLPADIYRATGAAAEAAKVREIDFNPKAQKEGNYYLSDAGVLMQREGGVGVRADEGKPPKTAAMLKDFVKLRDALKQAHYDQLNDGDWEASLRHLQTAYRDFTKKHGNILQNRAFERKVTREDEETGQVIEDAMVTRRFDLLNKINDDPDYTLVEALEKLNEETGEITESAFLRERVLAKPAEARIETPHDALLSVLNDTGSVDLPLIAERMGITEPEAAAALGTAIYESPSEGWQMADAYLSGNVKQKLAEAQGAAKADRRYERNVEALLSAQPAPVPPSDITAAIGMNWIPTNVYAQFLKEKTGVRATVDYNERTGQWTVTAHAGWQTPAATVDWGTVDRNAADILDHALTGRPIRVTRTEGTGSDRKQVFDPAATEAANQKLAQMRGAFAEWLWQDGERADTLTRAYNDKFNTIVARKFDGRHLTLPGSTTTIKVFDHVKRGAWRIIQAGNTYLAHAVGSGKTWQMVISAMEQKRLGLIQKPMMVVPNHMLQQFAREWLQLYPAARLMVADEKQFHTENRRRFVARVAMSDLDGVIITHSAFKLLDLDPEFKRGMIEEQLDYLRAALEEVGGEEGQKSRDPKVRDIQNRIEKMEQKLEAAMSGAGKDKNVRFDQLGVDQLYVDEAHEFRKLAFTTQRQVKGIDSSGSDRAFDLWMKTRWLEQKKPGRSLVMASGTPVTNTLAELYSVQKFMAPQVLEDRGLQDFDSWAAMFGQENTEIEADASGKYAPVTRFTKFVNVPELTQMFREYADVLTSDHLAEMLGDKRPKVKDGSRKLNITPQTDDYSTYKADLASRLEASRRWKPSRDEPNNPDPIIKIIGDGRLAAIDMRFIDPSLPSDQDSKLNQMIDGVIEVFKRTAGNEYIGKDGKLEPAKGGAQMVFSDLGFGAGVAANRGFNARAWFEKRLRDAGIPMNQVAFMSDHKKSSAKLKLFQDVNAGRVRILVGSSKNMGTGVNAQQRLIALHHLDTPWYPADLEQREGRIIRQGNKNPLVEIYAYSTKGSYDTVMWQMLASKQRFIDQALSGDSSVRSIDDLTEASQFQIATAMTAGDPRAIQLAGLKADIEKLQRLFRAHEETRSRLRREYDLAGSWIEAAERQMPDAEKQAARVRNLSGENFTARADGKTFDKRKEWGESLLATLKDYAARGKDGRYKVGEISGFPVEFAGQIVRDAAGNIKEYRTGLWMQAGDESYALAHDQNEDPVGMAMRATNLLASIARKPAELRQRIEDSKAKRAALVDRLDAKFQFAGEMADKLKEAKVLEAAMVADQGDESKAGEPKLAQPMTVTAFRGSDGNDRNDGLTYFADSEDVAKTYGPNVTRETLTFKNPLDLTDMGVAKRVFDDVIPDADPDVELSPIAVMIGLEYSRAEIAEWAKQNGYDGLIVPTTRSPDSMELTGRAFVRFAAPTINVDGTERPTADDPKLSRGTYTETPEFRRWFGDSKVVDASGKPLVVYHASQSKIDAFKPLNYGTAGEHSYFYFAASEAWSKKFAKEELRNGKPSMHKVYLSINNPLDLRGDAKTPAEWLAFFNGIGVDVSDVFRKKLEAAPVRQKIGSWQLLRSDTPENGGVRESLKAAGYDGLVISDWVRGKMDNTTYVAFSPTQIKSAISNSGEFSDTNPNILMSRGVGRGMSLRDLQAVVDRLAPGFKNLPRVHVMESPADLSTKDPSQKALRDYIRKADAWQDVEGATHDGEIYLFASGMEGELRAEHVFATHEITHYGLRGAVGKELDAALQHVWLNNGKVRKAAERMKLERGLKSNVEAVEEVLADMPSAELAKLTGWRKVVKTIRDWLKKAGAERLAARLDKWLAAGLDEQQQADLFVADLVTAAREWVRTGKGQAVMTGTRLADPTLADDMARQEKWLHQEATSRGYKTIDDLAEKNYPLFEKLATMWRKKNPVEEALLSRRAAGFRVVDLFGNGSRVQHFDDKRGLFYEAQKYPSGRTGWRAGEVIDGMDYWLSDKEFGSMEEAQAAVRGLRISSTIKQKNAEKYGAIPALWAGEAKRVARAIIDADIGVDRFSASTQSKSKYVYLESGLKVRIADHALPASYDQADIDYRYGGDIKALIAEIKEAEGDVFRAVDTESADVAEIYGSNFAAHGSAMRFMFDIPDGESIPFADIPSVIQDEIIRQVGGDVLDGEMVTVRQRKGDRVDVEVPQPDDSDTPDIRFSRAAVQGQQPAQTVAERADAIIHAKSGTAKPLEAIFKTATQAVQFDKLTTAIYHKAAFFLDRFTPETIKAGIVADYGIPEAVLDQRAAMQGRMRGQLRKTGELIEKLAMLTREESRVAYAWMNNADPQASAYLEQQLPPESVKVMGEVKQLIDQLSREAVRLGQLDPATYEKNRYEYLRRTYAKHVAEQTASDRKGRQRTIAILGDQYKRRGMGDAVDMAKAKAAAPEWWGRKLQAGKADKGLKGERFIRLERRAPSGEGTVPMEGMGERQRGRLQEVAYWPASEPIPTRYATWDHAGTWKVDDTKGDKLIMWRDFTKQERETMGEIDEARFAIARTMQGMIHDVEVGRFLEWLAVRYAKKEGERIDGQIVEASERMRDTFKPGEWVQVPDTKIPGTQVKKYGVLAGRYLPGPIWNDLRQVVSGRIKPLGETYATILMAWKSAKTALSPAVHMNNVMANVVIADWHDVTAGHASKALRILLAANQHEGKPLAGGLLPKLSGPGMAVTAARMAGVGGNVDGEVAKHIIDRFLDSGGSIGTWVTQELQREQLEPLMAALDAELALGDNTPGAQIAMGAIIEHLKAKDIGAAWAAARQSKAGKATAKELQKMIDLYEAEDQVFRLASWLKAKEDGASDILAGKAARRSFLDYNINAPWIQMMRQTVLPFIAFTYRALPMAIETAAKKPWKIMKLAGVIGALNALGYALSGGDEDDERRFLPEEKAGSIWGMPGVHKLVRMPWNDIHSQPVFLDIRRFVPVGDVFDLGQTHAALPMLPFAVPGGPLAVFGELIANKSQFTGRAIVLETDTPAEQATKVFDHLYKAFAPNLLGLPNTYATTGVLNAGKGKTDAFGRELSPTQALLSSVGIKVGSYPHDVLRLNSQRAAQAKLMEIDRNITALKRERMRNGIDEAEFREKVAAQQAKQKKLVDELRAK